MKKRAVITIGVVGLALAATALIVWALLMQPRWAEHRLAENLTKSPFTLFVPPESSEYPQPYYTEVNAGAPEWNFNEGLRIGLDAGPNRGITLYENKYAGADDPTKDCSKMYYAEVNQYGQHPSDGQNCKIVAVTPSGNTIYSGTFYVDEYFVIKQGTMVAINADIYTTEKEAVHILDSLVKTNGPDLARKLSK